MSARKAGMARATARKYLRQEDPTQQRRSPHTWRTRADPLQGLWPEALKMLRQAPELEAKALFEHLRQTDPSGIAQGLLRTFQRRVRHWRLKEGADKEVFFTQEHPPGKVLAVDWTEMASLEVTIQGRRLEGKLFHGVLPYSNWEWATRSLSESMLSFRAGLKATFGHLGRVTAELLVDHSSTATHQLHRDGGCRGFNTEFLAVCRHYGVEPRTINVARPQENGDCESSHGHLKRRMVQHMLLRGSRDFESHQAFDEFLAGVLESANRLRQERLGRELAVMREHTAQELPDYEEVMVTVGNNSTIRVRKVTYSVPSRLIGARLLARIYENRVVLLAGAQEVAQMPRAVGDSGAVIDFRHVIGHLARKPGAFAHYRWREEMFPSLLYRAAYDHLERASHEPERRYLEVLKVAAEEGVGAVENALEQILADPRGRVSAGEVKAMLAAWREQKEAWRQRPPLEVRLEDYDALLRQEEDTHVF